MKTKTMANITRVATNWLVWCTLSGVSMIVALFAGVVALILAAILLGGGALLLRSDNPFLMIGALLVVLTANAVPGLVIGLVQSMALNYMRYGELRYNFRSPLTLWWTIGTTLAGTVVWWVVDSGPPWLINQWMAVGAGNVPAQPTLVENATLLGTGLGALIGTLHGLALAVNRHPYIAFLWLILHILICAYALNLSFADLPAYDPEILYPRTLIRQTSAVAVLEAFGASAVLGGALLAGGIPPLVPPSPVAAAVSPPTLSE